MTPEWEEFQYSCYREIDVRIGIGWYFAVPAPELKIEYFGQVIKLKIPKLWLEIITN